MRPTADRVREALFARLGSFEDASVLDLFAGSGALGIEALSRGAAFAVFVERAPRVAAVLQDNLRLLDLCDRARLLRSDAVAAIRTLADGAPRFDIAFLDPPYADAEACARALRALATSGILAPRATVLVEASRRMPPAETAGLRRVDERRYGDTVLHRFEADPPGDHSRRESR